MKEFIISHKNEILPVIFASLWLLCEYLANNPKYASNSIFQAIRAGVAKLHAKQEAKKDLPPPAA